MGRCLQLLPLEAAPLTATSASTSLQTQLLPSVAIFTAGLASTSGCGRRWYQLPVPTALQQGSSAPCARPRYLLIASCRSMAVVVARRNHWMARPFLDGQRCTGRMLRTSTHKAASMMTGTITTWSPALRSGHCGMRTTTILVPPNLTSSTLLPQWGVA